MARPRRYDPKTEVSYQGRNWVIVRPVTASDVLLLDKATQETAVAPVADLQAVESEPSIRLRPLDAIQDAELAEARRRLDIIKPILASSRGRMKLYAALAGEHGVSIATLGRWVRAYEDGGVMSALAPRRHGRSMPSRLDPKAEEILRIVIQEFFLTRQRQSLVKTAQEVQRRCKARGVPLPHLTTIRARLKAVQARERVARRHGHKAARDRFDPVRGKFPDGAFPLAVVQIDHTKMDVEVVDDDSRQPIGRPWLTLAIDSFSRMVVGFHISLDPPSALSVGMCISHLALAKDEFLIRQGVTGDWPVWGIPQTILADNGKDFRSATLKRACDEYHVNISWRPVKTPHYGGYIERMMGTMGTELHSLPGTTFSNVQQKGEYDSAKRAVMTLGELTRWVTEFVVNHYHRRKHRGLGISPLSKWQEGILGHGRQKGIGLPAPVADARRFYLDFLPFTERTVRPEGIVWDNIFYYCETIRPWIRASKGGKAEKFIVRRDPRDISLVYFLDPVLKQYVEVPYRDAEWPVASKWEFQAARRDLAERGHADATVAEIFTCVERRQRIVDEATRETRRVRRERQRRKHTAEQLALRPPPAPVPALPAPNARLALVVDNKPAEDEADFDLPDDDATGGVEEW